MAEGPEMAGEFVFVPRIGVAAWLGGWVVGTDHDSLVKVLSPVEMGAVASLLDWLAG